MGNNVSKYITLKLNAFKTIMQSIRKTPMESRENTIWHPIKYTHTIKHTQMPVANASPTIFNQIVS
jgi:hypothetical protein